ncbi:MAG: MoaD/ThiS family protein [Anaerolineales bacterium]|uniref:MoaD/ThiS family protein n=1 Tax=Candidatus Desulfolinea nitratireducens TaxID=2841698 RepID=A0A8J6TDX2_9CHLR|nr:MoaD/ThiS family protein [Candidatus Desulfolinea nitratireducens]
MAILKIPTPLRPYTGGMSDINVDGENVGHALDSLLAQYPDIGKHLYNDDAQLRAFVNLFLGEDNIKDLQGLETPLSETDSLRIIPSIAGGAKG